ncbi:MAG: DNA repair protein RecN [Lentisphaeria bacterium]|nr:DNA repair protein RecN [Lentisphaeria bacterium]
MIRSLRIKNLALIEEEFVEFSQGLNLVTGETGAGKSVLIGSMQLLLGDRADKSLIRKGAEKCELFIELDLNAYPSALEEVNTLLEISGVPPCEDGQLIGSRTISNKSSRNFVNSSPVTLQLLKQLGSTLVDIHGPYENQSLLKNKKQMGMLDNYAGLNEELKQVAQCYGQLRELETELEELKKQDHSSEMLEYFKFQIKEIDEIAPKAGEDIELNEKFKVSANARELLQQVQQMEYAISDADDSLISRLSDLIRNALELQKIDAVTGQSYYQQIENTIVHLEALSDDLKTYKNDIDLDPAELHKIESRLGLLQRLKRKFGGTVDSAILYRDETQEKIHLIENHEQVIEDKEQACEKLRAAFEKEAAKLTRARKKAAVRLAPAITQKLKVLGFPDCIFDIEVSSSTFYSLSGVDTVEFMFAPNPGEGIRPLKEIASSGEVARVMLALKTVLAEVDTIPLLVFDEVDANIGGVVATQVARELQQLGKQHQVLCITHQPQVASLPASHFQVSKHTDTKRTYGRITKLSNDQRLNEIVRMLGGDEHSGAVVDHANELLKRG